MSKLQHLIYTKIIGSLPAVEQKRAAFYRAQVFILLRVLESLDKTRIIATAAEIEKLLDIGQTMNHEVDDCILIVKPRTYENWLRRRRNHKPIKRPGRKRKLSDQIVALIIRFVKENPGWGLLRIVGELMKLNIKLSGTTILKVCRENGITPPPNRTKNAPVSNWANFVKCNMSTMVSCDLVSKSIYTLRGRFDAYCIAFIHYASRRVYVSPPTYNPDEEWLLQQARNVAGWLDDEGIKLRFLIRDNDGKYTPRFDDFFQRIIDTSSPPGKDGKVIRTAIRCPAQNGYIESYFSHFKRECLNSFVCFSLGQLNRIVAQHLEYYNNCRPHQSLDNRVISPDFSYPEKFDASKVKCRKFLGGLLKHYYLEDDQDNQAA